MCLFAWMSAYVCVEESYTIKNWPFSEEEKIVWPIVVLVNFTKTRLAEVNTSIK